MTKKKETEVTWLSAPDIVKVLEEVNGRKINTKYIHMLVKQGRLTRKELDGRTFLYSKQDAESIHIIERKGAGRRGKAPEQTTNEAA